MSLEAKLDTILNKLEKIKQRLDNIENKFDKFETKLEELDGGLSKLETEFEEVLMAKPEAKALEVLNTKINNLKNLIQNYKKEVTMKESHDKRLNILIHGIKEEENLAWEKRDETVKKFKNFLENGLKIQDPEDMNYVDIHRLPQYPLKKNGKTVHRPI